jgi:hypothetical protein
MRTVLIVLVCCVTGATLIHFTAIDAEFMNMVESSWPGIVEFFT